VHAASGNNNQIHIGREELNEKLQLSIKSYSYGHRCCFCHIPTASGTIIFTNPAPITINDFGPATPYPATIVVSGLTTAILDLNVAINGLTHTFPSDIGILLVGPGGQKVVLMDGAGASIRLTTLISYSMTRRHQGFRPAGPSSLEVLSRPIFSRPILIILQRSLLVLMRRNYPSSTTNS
jgi:hypothetical protein